jgi:hypothetical protein
VRFSGRLYVYPGEAPESGLSCIHPMRL